MITTGDDTPGSPVTLCKFPIELLLPTTAQRKTALLAEFGLVEVPGNTDVYEDTHGELRMRYSNGEGNSLYTHKLFSFVVNILELGSARV